MHRIHCAGPPLDATIMAMRVHLLSNRFVTPLLIQQQRQQKKRSARAGSSSSSSAGAQGGSSSMTRGAAWCRPASTQVCNMVHDTHGCMVAHGAQYCEHRGAARCTRLKREKEHLHAYKQDGMVLPPAAGTPMMLIYAI
eukprot:1150170-Pelagomonas_calceolata.AAC.9